jgi:hypothetical protein
MSRSETSSSQYYRNRAICRKIMAEGTGLAVDRMTIRALHVRLQQQAAMILTYVAEQDVSSPPLARAAWELDALSAEIYLRGVQLTFLPD